MLATVRDKNFSVLVMDCLRGATALYSVHAAAGKRCPCAQHIGRYIYQYKRIFSTYEASKLLTNLERSCWDLEILSGSWQSDPETSVSFRFWAGANVSALLGKCLSIAIF